VTALRTNSSALSDRNELRFALGKCARGTFTINCFEASKSVEVEFAGTVFIGG
jgi:hypothetical protein